MLELNVNSGFQYAGERVKSNAPLGAEFEAPLRGSRIKLPALPVVPDCAFLLMPPLNPIPATRADWIYGIEWIYSVLVL